MSIDPSSYISALISPCKGIRHVPTVLSVTESENPALAAKVATVDASSFIIDVNPTSHSGGDFTGILDRVFRFEVVVEIQKYQFSFEIPFYLAIDVFTTGCGIIK